MANTHKTLADLEVVAFQFDPTDDPMPAALESDGSSYSPNKSADVKWKIKTASGYVFPHVDDWVVKYSTKEYFVLDNDTFVALFTAL